MVKLLLDDDKQLLDKKGVKLINTNLLKKERLDFQIFLLTGEDYYSFFFGGFKERTLAKIHSG